MSGQARFECKSVALYFLCRLDLVARGAREYAVLIKEEIKYLSKKALAERLTFV